MTDLPSIATSLPTRLGTTLSPDEDGEPRVHQVPRPATCNHGSVRASVLTFAVDVVGGLALDKDQGYWVFTSDLSLRIPLSPAPSRIDAEGRVLRHGERSGTCEVQLFDAVGDPFGFALIGFARVRRRDTDPAKPFVDWMIAADRWAETALIDEPVREVAGIEVLDASKGRLRLELQPDLLNPAGALQGSMVALLAEAAAEDIATAANGSPHVVTDLDIRFLAQARGGPLTTRAWFIGPPADGSVRVELYDAGDAHRLLCTALLRARPAL